MPQSDTTTQNKIFISNLVQDAGGGDDFKFFSSALARSIKTTLAKKFTVDFDEDPLRREKLVDKGYKFVIDGRYSVQGQELTVSFSVISVKKYVPIVQATVTGFPDDRIFDLVDKVCLKINEAVQEFLRVENQENQQFQTVVVKIDKTGAITKQTETMDEETIRKKLIGTWKLLKIGTFWTSRNFSQIPWDFGLPGFLTFKKNGEWMYWLTLKKPWSSRFGNFPPGPFGVKGKSFSIKIPAAKGGNATLYFACTHDLSGRYRGWRVQSDNYVATLLFKSNTIAEISIMAAKLGIPEVGDADMLLLWQKVK